MLEQFPKTKSKIVEEMVEKNEIPNKYQTELSPFSQILKDGLEVILVGFSIFISIESVVVINSKELLLENIKKTVILKKTME